MLHKECNIISYETINVNDQQLNILADLIEPIYLHFYPSSSKERILKRLKRDKTTTLDVLTVNGEIYVFAIYYFIEIGGKKIMFRDGTMVKNSEQSKGFYGKIVRYAIDKYRPDFITSRTQSPRIYETLWRLSPTGIIYPYEDMIPPDEIVNIARTLCTEGVFDPKTLVAMGVYTNGQGRRSAPYFSVRNKKVKDLFNRYLTEFDAFMVVVPVR